MNSALNRIHRYMLSSVVTVKPIPTSLGLYFPRHFNLFPLVFREHANTVQNMYFIIRVRGSTNTHTGNYNKFRGNYEELRVCSVLMSCGMNR